MTVSVERAFTLIQGDDDGTRLTLADDVSVYMQHKRKRLTKASQRGYLAALDARSLSDVRRSMYSWCSRDSAAADAAAELPSQPATSTDEGTSKASPCRGCQGTARTADLSKSASGTRSTRTARTAAGSGRAHATTEATDASSAANAASEPSRLIGSHTRLRTGPTSRIARCSSAIAATTRRASTPTISFSAPTRRTWTTARARIGSTSPGLPQTPRPSSRTTTSPATRTLQLATSGSARPRFTGTPDASLADCAHTAQAVVA